MPASTPTRPLHWREPHCTFTALDLEALDVKIALDFRAFVLQSCTLYRVYTINKNEGHNRRPHFISRIYLFLLNYQCFFRCRIFLCFVFSVIWFSLFFVLFVSSCSHTSIPSLTAFLAPSLFNGFQLVLIVLVFIEPPVYHHIYLSYNVQYSFDICPKSIWTVIGCRNIMTTNLENYKKKKKKCPHCHSTEN